jgi:hypothetical protein
MKKNTDAKTKFQLDLIYTDFKQMPTKIPLFSGLMNPDWRIRGGAVAEQLLTPGCFAKRLLPFLLVFPVEEADCSKNRHECQTHAEIAVEYRGKFFPAVSVQEERIDGAAQD